MSKGYIIDFLFKRILAFHSKCLGLKELPKSEDFFCSFCLYGKASEIPPQLLSEASMSPINIKKKLRSANKIKNEGNNNRLWIEESVWAPSKKKGKNKYEKDDDFESDFSTSSEQVNDKDSDFKNPKVNIFFFFVYVW